LSSGRGGIENANESSENGRVTGDVTTCVVVSRDVPMEIETRSFQMQINLSQIIVEPAIHHAQVQEEVPLRLKHSSPPTIINHILLNTGPVSAYWASSATS
jgi:hypothetical protein